MQKHLRNQLDISFIFHQFIQYCISNNNITSTLHQAKQSECFQVSCSPINMRIQTSTEVEAEKYAAI